MQHLKAEFGRFNNPGTPQANIWNAIKIACVNLDRTKEENYPSDGSGTTANIAIKMNEQLWIVNLGDSRAILVNPDKGYIQLSEDAKPSEEKYQKSVENRGGAVIRVGRRGNQQKVAGMLSVARSFGDNEPVFGGFISARPKITCYEEDEFKGKVLVQVCDGVTDVATSEAIGRAVRKDLKNNDHSLAVTAAKLVGRALEQSSQDNLTAMLTQL